MDYDEDALQNEEDHYQDDQDIDYEYNSESDGEFEADTDEEQSESDDNSGASAAQEALTETQEPMVLAQEEEPQTQVLTQEHDTPIREESNLRRSSRVKKTTHKMRGIQSRSTTCSSNHRRKNIN